jgi:hypothetical protein
MVLTLPTHAVSRHYYVKPGMLDSGDYETRRQRTGIIALRHVSILLTADLYLLLHNQTNQANCVHHIEKLYTVNRIHYVYWPA